MSDPEGNNRGLAIPTKKFDIWKDILEKLRRRSSAQAPGRASVPKSRAMPAAETEPLDQLLAERDALRKQVAEQQAKLAEAEAERDGYRRSALALLPKDEPLFSEEVLQEMKRTAVPLEDFIQELEQAPGKGTADDAGA